uniref:Uncharacterized protein n=1 Tax=viral metagenome TaxID=1070528 RepID=A0A6C0CSY3_9ZZZZ
METLRSINLRKFNSSVLILDKYELDSVAQSGTFVITANEPTHDNLVLKTADMRILSIDSDSITVSFEDERDIDAIIAFDDAIIHQLTSCSKTCFNETYTYEMIDEDVYRRSLITNRKTQHFSMRLYYNETLKVYDPSKVIIEQDRLVPNVIFRAALKPWTLKTQLKTHRAYTTWNIDHVMIVEEPFHTECVLDASDTSDCEDH